MMEKFKTFHKFLNNRINITLIRAWLSNKDLNISKIKKIDLIKVILKLECLFYLSEYIYFISSYYIFVEPFRLKQMLKNL